MCGAGRESRLRAGKRRLLEAAAFGALILPGVTMLPGAGWGQVAATLPEVTVTAPASSPPTVRRARAPAEFCARVTTGSCGADADPVRALPAFQVVATTPVTGLGFDRNKVPALVQTLSADDFTGPIRRACSKRCHSAFPASSPPTSRATTSCRLRYRGFQASPVTGMPQGLAVYRTASASTRLSATPSTRPDPASAIDRIDVWTGNPVFGLNALGGAINIQMKNGFT